MRLASRHVLALIPSLIASGVVEGSAQNEQWRLTRFAEREVAVDIVLERDGAGRTWLVGTFTPSRPEYHLYGKDLPKAGLHGVARPTLMELASSESLEPAGPLAADQPTTDLFVAALGMTFPVYPAGPVTLRLPVTRVRGRRSTAELSVTYMACSDRTCLAPVIDRRIAVRLPDTSPP
jgi:hypothetical protein